MRSCAPASNPAPLWGWALSSTLALALAFAPSSAAAAGDPVQPGVWRLHGTDPSLPQDDIAPLLTLVGDTPVVGLGEGMHTSGGFQRMRHRLIQELVEHAGFRVVAFESSWVGADRLDAYLQTCSGPTEAALGSIYGIWQSTEVRDFFAWACRWNRSHRRAADRLHVQGFDIQNEYGQIAVNARALRAFLLRIGLPRDDPRATGLDRCDGVATSVPFGEIKPEDYVPCAATLRALDELFTSQAAKIQRRTGKTAFTWAKLHRLGMAAWEDASFNLHRPSPGYFNARDRGMASTFLGLRSLRFPKSKTIIWAHNAHVGAGGLDPAAPETVTMGDHLRAALGSRYFTLAQLAKETEVDWDPLCGPLSWIGADPSLENSLHQRGLGDLLIDLHPPGVVPGLIPDGVQHLGDEQGIVAEQWDALVYLESSPRMHPLAWPPCGE